MQIANRPVQLTFHASELTATYTRSLKMQLALFRASTDQKGKRSVKMDKTEPMKFTTPGEPIVLSQTLNLLTTIPYDGQTRKYHSKEVEFEMALDIDGTKSRMNKKINLKELVGNKKQSKFSLQSPDVSLYYKMELKIEGQQSPQKTEVAKSPRRIKFQEDYLSSNTPSGESKQNIKEQPNRRGGSRHKTTFNSVEGSVEDIRFSQDEAIRKSRSQNRKVDKLTTVTEEKTLMNSERQIATRYEDFELEPKSKTRNQIDTKKSELLVNYRELERKLNEKESKLVELTLKIQQLEAKLELQAKKAEKASKDLLKKQQYLRSTYQSQILTLKQDVKNYKTEVDRLNKATLNYQESSTNIATSSEHQIKMLRDRVRHLERANQESVREGEYYQTNMKDKDTVINDLRGKIYSLDKQNLQLQTKVKLLENKLERINSDNKAQIQELEQKIQEMKEQNKTLRISNSPSSRGELSQTNKKIETLEKQLERKEELLKRMTDLKKEADSQRNIENQNMKKQIVELKQTIDKLESKQIEDNSSTTSIQYRVQMQRMKKEMQAFKKSESKMLIQKTRLQNLTNDLKDEVVKQKLKIANLLNIVQETADQNLISEVYCALQ